MTHTHLCTNVVTEYERHIIDEAIAAGKVQKIPFGHSAWRIEEGIHLSPGVNSTISRKQNEVIRRRKKIREMLVASKSEPEIYEAIQDINRDTLKKDINWVLNSIEMQRYGPEGAPPDMKPKKLRDTSEKAVAARKVTEDRREVVKSLCMAGASKTDIIRRTGSCYSTITSDLLALGMTCKSARGQNKRKAT